MDRKPLDISHCRGSRVLEKIAFPPDVAVLVAGEVPGYLDTLVQLHSYPIHWQVGAYKPPVGEVNGAGSRTAILH